MMDMEKLCERLLAIMDTNKEDLMAKLDAKLDANQEEMKADRNTDREEMLARMDASMKSWRENADAEMEAWQGEICPMRFETTDTRNETLACQEMEARQEEEEPSSVERKPEVAEREVPVEDAEVMPVGEPKKKRRRDRKLAAERRRQIPKDTTRENFGSQKRLTVARSGASRRGKVTRHTKETDKMSRRATVARRMRDIFRQNTTRHAEVARCKEITIRKVRTMDIMVRGTLKRLTFGRKRQPKQEHINRYDKLANSTGFHEDDRVWLYRPTR
jgi:hypothetical protein